MRTIKVAEVITRMDWAGSADIFRIICERLDKEAYAVYPVIGATRYPTPKTEKFFREFSATLVRIPSLKRDIALFDDIRALVSLYRLFRREKFDIVHTHTAKAGALARLAAHWAGVPVIVHTPHGHNFYGYFNRPASWLIIMIERALARLTDRIMALTELEKNDHLRYGVGSKRQLVVIPTGLEASAPVADAATGRQKFGIPPGDTLVGFIGRLEPVKGPEYLLLAARELLTLRQDISFLFVGEGSLRRRLQRQASCWKISHKVFFSGWQDDAMAIMAGMDVLAVPSLNEAVGLVILEAQSRGLAVVASSVGGIPEIVQDGRTAVLVPAQDAHALARALLALLDDPQKRQAMGQAAKERVRDRFSPERLAASLCGLYEQLMQENHGLR